MQRIEVRGTPRFENIDALRGIAVLLVVWLHSADAFVTRPGVTDDTLFDIADILGLGRMGVVVFFAISGYVIIPTLQGPKREGSARFFIKRFFRLYPAFWVAIGFACIVARWKTGSAPSTPLVLANMTMVPLELGFPQLMGHFWTLEAELIFYAIVATLFWTDTLSRPAVITWFLVLISIAWPILYRSRLGHLTVDHNQVWTFLSYFLTVMFWGSMLRDRQETAHLEEKRIAIRHWPFIVVSLLVFGRPLIALAFGSTTVNREEWRGTLLGLILFLVALKVPRHFCRHCTFLGTISYSLYLLHPLTFFPVRYMETRLELFESASLFIPVVIATLMSIVLAAASYRFIERPFNAIGRRISARYRVLESPRSAS